MTLCFLFLFFVAFDLPLAGDPWLVCGNTLDGGMWVMKLAAAPRKTHRAPHSLAICTCFKINTPSAYAPRSSAPKPPLVCTRACRCGNTAVVRTGRNVLRFVPAWRCHRLRYYLDYKQWGKPNLLVSKQLVFLASTCFNILFVTN